MRKFTIKKFFALFLIPIVLFIAIYCPSPAVYADSLIDDLVYYGLSVSGYMRLVYDSGGGGHSFGRPINPNGTDPYSKNLFTNLRDAVQNAYDNRHIEVNTNGDIVFDQTATNNFYTVMNGSGLGGFNAILLGSNPLYNDYSTNSHVSGSYQTGVESIKQQYPGGLYLSWQQNSDGWSSSNKYELSTNFIGFDLTNVAYVSIAQNAKYLQFYDSSYNAISVSYSQISCSHYYRYNPSNAVTFSGNTGTAPVSPYWINSYYDGNKQWYPDSGNLTLNAVANSWSTSIHSLSSSQGWSTVFYFSCPKGVVVGANEANARGAYNWMKEPDYICPNITNVFPTISNDTYNNTNFQETYNNYVTNVNNTYDDLNNPSFDIDDFRQIAQDQNDIIINAIDNGVNNITSVVSDTNQKLDTIIGLLMHIRDMLKEFDGGGGSSGGGTLSAEQINQLLSDLAYIKNNILTATTFENSMIDVQNALYDIQIANEDNYDQLVDINNNLVDIYNALIGQGGTTQNNYYYGDNYYINNYHNNNKNMDDFIDDAQDSFDDSVIDAMKGVVPFVFIIMAGSLFEKLATDPEAPHFEIPFKIDSFGIDESIEIDLANYGAVHDVLDLGWCMLLIAALMVVTFKALYLVASTFF